MEDTYYNRLVQHPKTVYAYDFTTALSCASVKNEGTGSKKVPPEFDTTQQALLQWTDPSKTLMNPVQKWPRITTYGESLVVVWEFMVGAGCRFLGKGYQPIVKAWRWDTVNQGFFLASKLDFSNAKNDGPAGTVAEFLITSQTKLYLGPGTSRLSEVLQPTTKNRCFCFPGRWYRAVAAFMGYVGDGALIKLSVWVSSTEKVIQLYDNLNLYTPPMGVDKFRYEFNTSAKTALNPRMEYWNRHLVALQGLTPDEIPPLLQTV